MITQNIQNFVFQKADLGSSESNKSNKHINLSNDHRVKNQNDWDSTINEEFVKRNLSDEIISHNILNSSSTKDGTK